MEVVVLKVLILVLSSIRPRNNVLREVSNRAKEGGRGQLTTMVLAP